MSSFDEIEITVLAWLFSIMPLVPWMPFHVTVFEGVALALGIYTAYASYASFSGALKKVDREGKDESNAHTQRGSEGRRDMDVASD